MQTDDEDQNPQLDIIHSGLTFFPSYKQILTLIFLVILEVEGIYICLPLNRNSNMSFLIGQLFLLIIIVYSWYMILSSTPGPMSQLFNEQFIKKTIEKGFQQQHQNDQMKICTKCQIEKVAKLYHCQQCNRCVYKHFFHSSWLNMCIAKQNFTSFIAFLMFLEIYLILLEIDTVMYFVTLRNQSDDTLASFFIANIQHALISSYLLVISILMLLFVGVICSSYFLAFRIKASVQPYSCKQGCQGLKKIGSNDKILYKIRQSIRQSNYFNQNQSESQHSNQELFKQTQIFSAKQFNIKAIKKSFMNQSKQMDKSSVCSIQDYQGPFFKTDFFSSAKIFRKKQNSIQQARNKKISRLKSLNDDISNMTSDKWKSYIKSTFQKDSYIRRNSELTQVIERKATQQYQTPSQMKLTMKISQKDKSNQRDSIIKSNSLVKRKILPQISECQPELKQSSNSLHLKKIRFIKRSSSNNSNLAEIFQKESKLQDG